MRALALLLFVVAFASQSPAHASCGKVSIADMNWPSATMIAHVDLFILKHGFGCDADVVPGDTMPTGTSMMTLTSSGGLLPMLIASMRIYGFTRPRIAASGCRPSCPGWSARPLQQWNRPVRSHVPQPHELHQHPRPRTGSRTFSCLRSGGPSSGFSPRSRNGFSSSCSSTYSASSKLDSCNSLIACCNCGVITSC